MKPLRAQRRDSFSALDNYLSICKVRVSGTAAVPLAFLSAYGTTPGRVVAAPMNLEFVDPTSKVSLGHCEDMQAPTESSLYAYGSQSGMRKVGAPYAAGSVTGGGASRTPNQLIWNIGSPFLAGEQVDSIATSANRTSASVAATPFVGRFRVKGSIPDSSGTFGSPILTNAWIEEMVLGDLNGDGAIDIVALSDADHPPSNSSRVTLRLGDGAGAFLTPVTLAAPHVSDVAIADVTGDGKLDLVTSHAGSSSATSTATANSMSQPPITPAALSRS